jgi:hypothetical protein
VTESRISQIVTAAVGKLRQQFGIALLPPKRKTAPRTTASRATPNEQVALRAQVAA